MELVANVVRQVRHTYTGMHCTGMHCMRAQGGPRPGTTTLWLPVEGMHTSQCARVWSQLPMDPSGTSHGEGASSSLRALPPPHHVRPTSSGALPCPPAVQLPVQGHAGGRAHHRRLRQARQRPGVWLPHRRHAEQGGVGDRRLGQHIHLGLLRCRVQVRGGQVVGWWGGATHAGRGLDGWHWRRGPLEGRRRSHDGHGGRPAGLTAKRAAAAGNRPCCTHLPACGCPCPVGPSAPYG